MITEYYIIWGMAIIALILSCYAQFKVSNDYNKYSKVMARSSITAKVLARQILDIAGLKHIQIVNVRGVMTDYYNHKKGIIALSDGVSDSSSIAALGIMAHEVGHALQYQAGYFPIKLRNFAGIISNWFSKLMWPMLIIGVILDIFIITDIRIGSITIAIVLGFFILTTLFSLITLPVERDASRRALQLLQETRALDDNELQGAKAVLNSAGLTYVASFVGSLVNLLRIILIFSRDR